jgi:hypothetical protein
MEDKVWKKFYECDCGSEGVAISYEIDGVEGMPVLDLAFFSIGLKGKGNLTFFGRLRWCWHILIKGYPWCDAVILNQKISKELGEDLLEFANKKYKFGGSNDSRSK